MKNLKVPALSLLLALWGLLNASMWRNGDLVARAGNTEDPAKRISLLEAAAASFPLDFRAPYELGRARFDSAFQDVGAGPRAEGDLSRSVADLRRSVRLNPYFSFSHFQLGQSMLYLGTVSSADRDGFLVEYKKAISLADFNSEFLLEVGRTSLSRWEKLSEEDRAFVVGVLKKLLSLRDQDRAEMVFQAWVVNSGDFELMRKVLPDDPRTLRAYADFLAGRSLSLTERQSCLAKAEGLEFEAATENLAAAESALSYLRLEQAEERLQSCLGALRKIRFYQDLVGEKLIDPEQYKDTLRSCRLALAKCGLESGRGLKDVLADLEGYLALESRLSSLNELETYLADRGLVDEGSAARADEPEIAAFRMRLLLKRNRYLDIVQWGRSFQTTLAAVPTARKDAYVRLFHLLGDACQRAGFPYDSREYYRRALALDPLDLETLVRIKRSAELLNDESGILEAEQAIAARIARPSLITGPYLVEKGQSPSWRLQLDGTPRTLELHAADIAAEPFPLLSVVFNNRIVWEGYAGREAVTAPLKPDVGVNVLAVSCLNRGVALDKLAYR